MMRAITVALFVLAIIVFCLPSGLDAAKPAEAVKLGEITKFSGDVLVRTQTIWTKLEKTPYPIFSSDKIVTRKGRAEINFIDGGLVRMNIDSNISIERQTETEGIFSKKKKTSRVVNVLIGDIWFEIKLKKDKGFKFRTPTMIAGIRGTEGTAKVNRYKRSSFGLSSGNSDNTGTYDTIPDPSPLTDSDVTTSDLPQSDSSLNNYGPMKSANDAYESRSNALNAASRADADNETAKASGDQATKSQATSDKLNAARLGAAANTSEANASLLDANANLTDTNDQYIEAQLFNDTDEMASLQNDMDDLNQEIAGRQQTMDNLGQMQNAVDQAVQTGDLGAAEDALQESNDLAATIPPLPEMPPMVPIPPLPVDDEPPPYTPPPDEPAPDEPPPVEGPPGGTESGTTSTYQP
jgi:hypothetical protein